MREMSDKQRNFLKSLLAKYDKMDVDLHWSKEIEEHVRSLNMSSMDASKYIDWMLDAGVIPWDKGEKPSEKQIGLACYLVSQVPDNKPEAMWDEEYFRSQTKAQISRSIDKLKKLTEDEDFDSFN